MPKKLFEDKKSITVDSPLNTLENIRQKKEAIIAEEVKTIREIRSGFEEVVVIFIDMVDSTKFKTANHETPEKWILRVRQFSEIVTQYVTECSGKIVKYIGDEVMAVLNRESKIKDVINFLNRINDLQADLSEITGENTTVKVALDLGKVYFLTYEGHTEPDPQGTAVDRCARIAKYCKAGVALTSFDLVEKCDNPKLWTKVGEVDLKGIGRTKIYQYGEGTIEIISMVEISENELKQLKDKNNEQASEVEDLKLNLKESISANKELVDNLKEAGKKVEQSLIMEQDSEEEECEKKWSEIKSKIVTLKKLISDSNANSYEYARFLFLHQRSEYWEYNVFTGDEFKSSIESNLVRTEGDSRYKLDPFNKRNKRAINVMGDIDFLLEQYEAKCRNSDEELFDYNLETPEFWERYIGYTVTR